MLPVWSSQVLRCWAQPASGSPGRKQAPFVYFLYKYTEARSKKGQGSETTQLGSVVSVPAFLPMPLKEHIYLFLRELVGFVVSIWPRGISKCILLNMCLNDFESKI